MPHPPYVVKAAHRLAAEGLPRSAIAAHLRLTTSAVCGMLWRASEHASGEKPRLRPTHAVCVQARFAGRYKICSAPRPMEPNHSQQIVEPSRELPGFQPYSSRLDPKKSSFN